MIQLAGMTATGRQVVGPASTLVEFEDAEQVRYMAIIYDAKYRQLTGLNTAVHLAMNFLQCPLVLGLVELSHHHPEEGAFFYPTSSSWSIAEILRLHRQEGVCAGHRAGLELCYLAGLVLTEASESGALQGVYSHGDLSPWRIVVQGDGDVQIIGYGLPQADLLLQQSQPDHVVHPDALRYSPPERLEGQPEDNDDIL